ncbi:MAG: hypothetical protein PVF65_06175 [Sphingomonadales bacterium]|jgi:glutathione synthase/RimK-type ligase-like ATP-grasp enzyme
MPSDQLIVLGTRRDPHIDWVCGHIEALGVNAQVIDHEASTPVKLEVGSNGSYNLVIEGEPLSGRFLIWHRVKLIRGMSLFPKGDVQIADLRAKEWRSLYRLIAKIFSDRTVNTPDSFMIMHKPYQQILAAQVGLSCPETLVSNTKSDILDFVQNQSGTIMKSLSGDNVLPKNIEEKPHVVMTMEVNEDQIAAADADSFSACPHMVQTNVSKKYEIRAVVIDDLVFAFKIESQIDAYYAIDWRRGNATLEFTPFDLDDRVKAQLIAFNQKAGLFSGSFDLIVDLDGKHWFLECNQDGQWGWLDKIVDGAISKAFAHAFKNKIATLPFHNLNSSPLSAA